MSWARSLIDSDIASWIFSDECYVHLFRNSNLCKEGINATIEEPINWKTSIMIWGGISIVFGKMLFIKKEKYAINAQVYIRDILQDYIEPLDGDYTFVQDGANSPYCKADYGILQRKRDWCEDSIAEEPRSQSNWDDLGQFEEESGEKKAWQQSQIIAAIQESWDEISFEEVQNSILKVKNEKAGHWSARRMELISQLI
ncbi:unnamed protein product [Blepharisma stoltei]|uniref:Transposase n=1 Tax=Blepharisma stoltei TaxID=1481888 RepID=A0AAU9IJ26_9CILI|nr:unnamed protein product [Blepharisma stoltei]